MDKAEVAGNKPILIELEKNPKHTLGALVVSRRNSLGAMVLIQEVRFDLGSF